jgi:hypothetical protein
MRGRSLAGAILADASVDLPCGIIVLRFPGFENGLKDGEFYGFFRNFAAD